jgi:hypothetical protein
VSFAAPSGDCSCLFIRTLSGRVSPPCLCSYLGQASAEFNGDFSRRLIGQFPDRLIAPLIGKFCGKRLARFPGPGSARLRARLIGRLLGGLPAALPTKSLAPLFSKLPAKFPAQLFGRPLSTLALLDLTQKSFAAITARAKAHWRRAIAANVESKADKSQERFFAAYSTQ